MKEATRVEEDEDDDARAGCGGGEGGGKDGKGRGLVAAQRVCGAFSGATATRTCVAPFEPPSKSCSSR
jgi:hypothetical protein